MCVVADNSGAGHGKRGEICGMACFLAIIKWVYWSIVLTLRRLWQRARHRRWRVIVLDSPASSSERGFLTANL